jgi:hypothetical protein
MDHLHGEFDAEPGRGDERSEHLRNRRIKTYLVVFDHPRKVSATESACFVAAALLMLGFCRRFHASGALPGLHGYQ